MVKDLIKFWRGYDLAAAPYVHPEDKNTLLQKNPALVADYKIKTYKEYINSPEFSHFESAKFHLSLLPSPYVGNLKKAEIVILLLNPGLSLTDYYGEMLSPACRRALKDNLYQHLSKKEFPFLWLNPEFCWHGGFMFWEKKLRGVLKTIAEKKFKGNYLQAVRSLSQKIAMIELVPYHSAKFKALRSDEQLSSTKAAVEYVHKVLMPAAQSGKKTLIVLRGKKAWNIKAGRNIVIYDGPAAIGASLSPKSKGGRAILRRYGLR